MSEQIGGHETVKHFIQVTGLSKKYSSGEQELEILSAVDLEIKKGEILLITGESGSGKTTLLNILGGLDRADSGSIRIGDLDLTGIPESKLHDYRRHHLGFIFQFHHLLKDFSARENIMLPARIAGMDEKQAAGAADELIQRLGISSRSDHFPYQLSGGERQRVAIARALINDPDLILADEPTGSLDENRSREVEALLFDLVRERRKTMIIVTHDTRLARMGDRALKLSSGGLG